MHSILSSRPHFHLKVPIFHCLIYGGRKIKTHTHKISKVGMSSKIKNLLIGGMKYISNLFSFRFVLLNCHLKIMDLLLDYSYSDIYIYMGMSLIN